MPPASSTSGGAHGVLSHAMSPVCEATFDLCASTRQSASIFSLCHAAVTPCLQRRWPRPADLQPHSGWAVQALLQRPCCFAVLADVRELAALGLSISDHHKIHIFSPYLTSLWFKLYVTWVSPDHIY